MKYYCWKQVYKRSFVRGKIYEDVAHLYPNERFFKEGIPVLKGDLGEVVYLENTFVKFQDLFPLLGTD